MPIRFRCVYCNQLLGISRRKAGTIVRCTSCEGQLIVPEPVEIEAAPDGHELGHTSTEPPKSSAPVSSPEVFAASDFDAFLEPLSQAGAAVASPPAPLVQRPVNAAPSPALILSRRSLIITIVGVIVALGLAFAGGLWTGRWL
jgi:hypothetical protein